MFEFERTPAPAMKKIRRTDVSSATARGAVVATVAARRRLGVSVVRIIR
jgi:hypothetical protein